MVPPETTTRSHSKECSEPPARGWRIASVTTLLPRASMIVWPLNTGIPSPRSAVASAPASGRRSATATIWTPTARSARAACSPRSDVVAMTARLPGLTPVEGGQAARTAGEHHAGQVVAREHQRLLDGPGGEHVAGGADLVQGVALPHGHQPVEVAQRGAMADDLYPGLAHVGDQCAQLRMT